MRKSRILTFFFSLFPGAGQMYLGYMKRGLSLMGAFWGVIGVCMFFRVEFLLLLLPIIWFYAFFDALNLRLQTYDEPYCPSDDYLFHLDFIQDKDWNRFFAQRHLIIGILCMFFGIYLIFTNIIAPFLYSVFDLWVYDILRFIPTLAVSLAIIVFGLYLVRGDSIFDHKALEDDLKEYDHKDEQ